MGSWGSDLSGTSSLRMRVKRSCSHLWGNAAEGGRAVLRALWEGSRSESEQAEIPHSMAQQLPLSWDAPRVPSTGVTVPGESDPSISSPHPTPQHQLSDTAKQRFTSSEFSHKPQE